MKDVMERSTISYYQLLRCVTRSSADSLTAKPAKGSRRRSAIPENRHARRATPHKVIWKIAVGGAPARQQA